MACIRLVSDSNMDHAASHMPDGCFLIVFEKTDAPLEDIMDETADALSQVCTEEHILLTNVQSAMYTARMFGVPDDGLTSIVVLKRDGKAKCSEFVKRLDGNPSPATLWNELAPLFP